MMKNLDNTMAPIINTYLHLLILDENGRRLLGLSGVLARSRNQSWNLRFEELSPSLNRRGIKARVITSESKQKQIPEKRQYEEGAEEYFRRPNGLTRNNLQNRMCSLRAVRKKVDVVE